MAAPGYTETVADINENLKPLSEGGPRFNKGSTVRALLLRTIKWISDVYDACASFGSFYAVDGTVTSNRTINVDGKRIKFTNVGGWQVDGTGYWAVVNTNPASSLLNYIPLLSLPASSGVTLDFVVVEAIIGGWTGGNRQHQKLYFSNRDGFAYRYSAEGPNVPSRIEAYQVDGVTTIYAVLTNAHQMVKVCVPFSYQANLVDSLTLSGVAPAGTKVFDSSRPAQYVPNLLINDSDARIPRTLRVPSFSLPIRSDSYENRFGGLLSNYLAGIVQKGLGTVSSSVYPGTSTITFPTGVSGMTEGWSDCQILGGNSGQAIIYYSIPAGLPNPSNYYRFFINARTLAAGAITRIQINVYNSTGVESIAYVDDNPVFNFSQWSAEVLATVSMPIKGVKFIMNIAGNADIRLYELGVYNNNMVLGENILPYLIRDNLFTSNQQIGTTANPKDLSVFGVFKSYLGGALQSWKLGAAKSTSGATLKTTEYIEVEINGSIKKLAVLN